MSSEFFLVLFDIICIYFGKNLARFIIDFHLKSPKTKFRLLGHSLGSEVIYSTLVHLEQTWKI